MKIKKMIKKMMYGHKSDSEAYISYLKSKGMRIGVNCTIYVPTKCIIDETRPWMIEIGNNVEITEGVTILTHGYDWSVFKHCYGDCMGSCGSVVIGNNVFIGTNATILKNVTVGDNCIVGANSLLAAGVYPSNSVIVGAPAKVFCDLDTYYRKRKKNQLQEAKDLYSNYKKSFDIEPTKEVFREFFWLFENRKSSELIPEFRQVMELGGEIEKAELQFMSTKPIFNSYEEFLVYCRGEGE